MIEDPREYIRGIIKAMRKTQKEFCNHAGIGAVNFAEFLNHVRPLSKKNCLKLEKTYGISFIDIMTYQINEWYEQHKNEEK